MANSKRKCAFHGKRIRDYIVVNNMAFCSYESATKWGYANKAKGKKIKENNNRKAVVDLNKKSLKYQHRLTQPIFNKLRRLQEFKWFNDRGLEPVCISCGKPLGNDQWCNGHFKSVGSNGRLRYDFLNSYLQHNKNCNMHLSGDIKRYEPGLITRFGDDEGSKIIAYCEENNTPIKYTWQDIEALRFSFNKQIKELIALT
ncbi:MAG: recombination protein NinG [Colwellia sp.]|nr:recombination protein NinG [Colwellia sp.]